MRKYSGTGDFLAFGGEYGYEQGQFWEFGGLALNDQGDIYVADLLLGRIQKFDKNKNYYGSQWVSWGPQPGRLDEPSDVALDALGNVYVADMENWRIQKFDANGTLLLSDIGLDSIFPVAVAVGPLTGSNSDKWNRWTLNGVTLGGGVIWASHYAEDASGNVVGNLKLYKANGQYIDDWFVNNLFTGGIAFDAAANLYVALPAIKNIYKFNISTGEGTTILDPENDLKNLGDVAVDNDGNIYAVDIGDLCRISKFNSSGTFIKKWLPNGSAGCDQLSGERTWPTLSTDGSSRLAAAFPALQDDHLQIFNLDGVFQTEIGGSGNIPGRFNWVEGTAFDADGNLYLADRLNSRIEVFKPRQLLNNAKAIIVAGGGPFPGNNLWDTTQMAANAAYWRLAYQGYSKDDITYLSSNTNLDLDGDGTPDVDGDATYTNLNNAIINASDADNLVVYLAGHGGSGTFRIGSNEQIGASEIRTSLDALQNNPGFDDPADPNDGQVFIIYDACESGSFITGLTPSAGKKRVTITSTSPGERAAFISNGAVSFSNYFWNGIFRGEDVRTAFQSAKTAIAASSTGQIPMMDANGDGISNNTDLTQMTGVSIGNGTSVASDAPAIGTVDTSVNGNTLTVTTTFADPGDIGRVWVVVRPPDLLDNSITNPVQGFPNFNLLPVSEGSRDFSGTYDALSASGNYELAVYASDKLGYVSLPQLKTVNVSGTKPRKAVLVAGGELSDANWQAISTNAQLAYTALRKQGYIDNDIQYLGANQNVTGWDAFPSTLTISDAITTWAKSNAQELVIYLVGGGSNQAFRLNQNQTLTAVQLDGWLDSLQSTLPGILTIVYDADLSGSFIPLLKPPSGKPRIVVTGTNAVDQANFLGNGSISFSNYFWSGVFNGDTVWEAWLGAKRAIEFAGSGQSAQLDDDGGGNPNQKTDGSIARYYRVGAGILFAGNEPLLGTVTNAQILAGATTANFSVDGVTSTGTIDRVWAVITAPHGSTAAVAEIAMTLDRTDPEGNRYLGSYNGFMNYGTYEILVYAEDTNGIVSDPIATSVVQTIGPDVYEVDDMLNQSKVVNLNDEKAQEHNFHNAGDKDWVKFYAFQNETYEITAENVGSKADVVIKLYASDKITLLRNVDATHLGGTELISWSAPQNGIYYLRVNEAANRFGANTDYELRVYRPFGPGEFFGIIRGIVASDFNLARLSGALVTSKISGVNDGVALTLDDGSYILVTKIGANIQVSSALSGFQPASDTVNQLTASEIVEVNFNLSGIDTDSDGIPDSHDPDDDNDTIPDSWETVYGLNPLSADDANQDDDLDGLTNLQEYQFGSDPTKVDSDGDGYTDREEYDAGSNPLDENDVPYPRRRFLPAVIPLLLE